MPRPAATGSEMSVGVLWTSGDVVAIDNERYGFEREIYRSILRAVGENSLLVPPVHNACIYILPVDHEIIPLNSVTFKFVPS